jgi:hypothetical protein
VEAKIVSFYGQLKTGIGVVNAIALGIPFNFVVIF